jgi:hypothetical protein
VIYGDDARDVRVFNSYFARCSVLVSYWYIWIGILFLWVLGLGKVGVRAT